MHLKSRDTCRVVNFLTAVPKPINHSSSRLHSLWSFPYTTIIIKLTLRLIVTIEPQEVQD
ncbi:hypothetical protein RchiOBHm_Chr1g0320211 [Rosa chinensis]|uniref:Uncharacterized protein n=1 Tax=Rosa chinensis TaxID=74649 RepID=A0A2P6S8M4_ROSCH|nr:hypothetical protein RchiOBHm_Chr1g0320211 [Rosa chinensis]